MLEIIEQPNNQPAGSLRCFRLTESLIEARRDKAGAGHRKNYRLSLHGFGLAMPAVNAGRRRITIASRGFEEAPSWRFSDAEAFSWS